MKIKLANQSLNLLRQFISVPGVAKTSAEIYQDGELLCDILPELDLSWVLTSEQQAALSPELLKEYQVCDKSFSAKEVEFELTEKQVARIKAVLAKVPELCAVQQTKFLFALYRQFHTP